MTIAQYLILSSVLFCIGIYGVLARKNGVMVLMSIELMLVSVNINFVAFSVFLQDMVGQIFTMFILTVAAAEASIGLAILVCFYRLKNSILIDDASSMKG